MQDLQTLFLDAVSTRKRGDAAAARRQFDSLLASFPDCHEALYMHGMLSAELGDLVTAESRLRQALVLDPGNPEYLYRLGSVLHSLGREEDAVETLLEAEKEGEESVPLLLALGSACFAAVRIPEAERAFRRAAEIDPANPDPGRGLLATLMGAKKMDEACTLARSLAARHPRLADLHARLAQVLERTNRVEEASAAVDAALAINPDEPTALWVRALLLQRSGDKEGSIQFFERALAHTVSRQERRDISRALGLVLDELGRHEEAYARFLDSKKTLAEIPSTSAMLARDIERFIEACRRDLRPGVSGSWPDPPPDHREPPVFFVGFPRSGTTLLEQILAAHPRLVTSDEIESLGRCTEWIGQQAGGLEFAPARYGSLTDQEVMGLREMYWNRMEEEMGRGSLLGRRLIDKQPLNTVSLFTARRIFPWSKVIVSIRDPRDVVLSCFMHLSRTPMAVTYFRDLESAAALYAKVMGLWFHMRTALGLPWMEVRYEDLVEDTEGTARRVFDFIGEPWDESVLEFTKRAGKKAIRSTSYQQVTQGVHKRALGRWRAYERHFGGALEILRPLAESLGYGDR